MQHADPIVTRRDFVKTSAALAAGGLAVGAMTRRRRARGRLRGR